MKNLYERLQPEILKALNIHAESYPTVTNEILKELKKRKTVSSISFGIATDLASALDIAPRFSQISKLFKNEEAK